jgi:glycosyltransferase involved in cell wall biosynthesis
MKIVVLQDRLRAGGTERQAVFLARSFAACGCETTFVTFRPGGPLAPELAAAGVRHISLQPVDLGLDWFAPGLCAKINAERPDVVLCMGRMANCHAGHLQRTLRHVAVVATVRTGKHLPHFYRDTLRTVRGIITNSEFARRQLVAPARPTAPIAVIPNALLVAGLATAESIVPAEPPYRILCIAMFRKEKNHFDLIEICSRLPRIPEWHLDLVGDGSERAACEARVRELGIADCVTFHGWARDPAPFYRRAAVAVLASRRESLPNFLVEAQSAGVPVVAYDVGGCGECFADGSSGLLIAPGDEAAFRAALSSLLSNPARRTAMARTARDRATTLFSPGRSVRAHLDFFDRVLERSQRPAAAVSS